jgi:hypothetical protein
VRMNIHDFEHLASHPERFANMLRLCTRMPDSHYES